MPRTTLVDADIVVYKFATSVDIVDVGDGVSTRAYHIDSLVRDMELFIEGLKKATGSEEVVLCFSHGKSFRSDIYPPYKLKRHSTPKPPLCDTLKQILLKSHNCVMYDRLEGDDVLSILQTHDTVIASLDKDLLQVPGEHYNWKSKEHKRVHWMGAITSFLAQVITGDATDEYPGIEGYGPAAAANLIANATATWLKVHGPNPMYLEEVIWDSIVKAYKDDEVKAITQARMAYLLKPEDYDIEQRKVNLWVPPKKRLLNSAHR